MLLGCDWLADRSWPVIGRLKFKGKWSRQQPRPARERERAPADQPAAAALWRGLSLYLWLSSPHKMPTFAHCATSDHQDLVSPHQRSWQTG